MNQDEAKKQAFHNDMINLYKTTSKQLKYKSTKLLDMINKYGGYEAAIKFINSESNTFDFTILWENERLDLSVEALITNSKYRELFPDEIVSFCDRKLKDYNFSPKKIIEEKKEIQEESKGISTKESQTLFPEIMPMENKKEYIILNRPLDIDQGTWKELFMSDTVFPTKNKDLILRIALIDGFVQAAEISEEEGYNVKYPYKEVVMALAKRIKAKTKVDVPKSRKGELLWWHILFLGGFKDNTCFEWRVRPELKKAIEELIKEGKIDISQIQVKLHKEIEEDEEEVLEPVENIEIVEEKLEKVEEMKEPKSEVELKAIVEPRKELTKKAVVQEANEEDGLDSFIDSLLGDMELTPKKKIIPAKKSKDPFDFEEIIGADNMLQDLEDDKLEAFIEGIMENKEPAREEAVQEEPIPIKPVMETKVIDKQSDAFIKECVEKPSQSKESVEWQKIKNECLEYYGAICEICGFDYGYTYGETFEKDIQIHHVNGLEESEQVLDIDPVKDLVPICHNCHSIIHSKTPAYTVDEMRVMLKNAH